MGFDFVKTCSRCDYYLQNRALNMKALKLPRSELSSMWQCTGRHQLSELITHSGQKTPYRPAPITKQNSYICSSHETNNSASGKRVRLFADTPQSEQQRTAHAPSLVPSPAPSPVPMLLQSVLYELNKCQQERDEARAELHSLQNRFEQLLTELDEMRADAEKARTDHMNVVNNLQSEIQVLRARCNDLVDKNELLTHNNNEYQQSLVDCQKRVASLVGRVAAIEKQQDSLRSKQPLVVGRSAPLKYIQQFVKALFPDLRVKNGLNELFLLLYTNKKPFRLHVNKKVRESILPLIQMDVCRQIRKHYTPWRFLEVLDCSKQSLNQVTAFNFFS
jgi:hypothetical protein